jgi:hypothetical protein
MAPAVHWTNLEGSRSFGSQGKQLRSLIATKCLKLHFSLPTYELSTLCSYTDNEILIAINKDAASKNLFSHAVHDQWRNIPSNY